MASDEPPSPDTGPSRTNTVSPAPTPATTAATGHRHRHGHRRHGHHHRRRPEEFVLPDGRLVLVALSDEAARLREKYAADPTAAPQVEVVVHGSPEHEAVLRETQAHHTARRAALRAEHGDAVYDAYDQTTAELDRVSAALAALAVERTKSHDDDDHAAAEAHKLGHNFSKFGYSANLRTIGPGESAAHRSQQASRQTSRQTSRQASRQASMVAGLSGGSGGSGSPGGAGDTGLLTAGGPIVEEDSDGSSSGSGSGSDDSTDAASSTSTSTGTGGPHAGGVVPAWQNENNGRGMRLFRRPIVKQYYHKGLLWRESGETTVQSFELFFDLLYVGILAINGDHAAEEADGFELLRFVVTFCLSWKIWSDVTQLVSWFDENDVVQRVELLVLYSLLLGVTVNNVQTFGGWAGGGVTGGSSEGEWEAEGADTYPALVAFYVTARLFMALFCASMSVLVPMVRGTMLCQAGLIVVAAALWISSIHLAMPVRLACTFVALAFDLFGGSLVVGLFRYAMGHATRGLGQWLMERVFTFYPMINIEHKVERTNAFMTLVLGYSVVGVLYQSSGIGGSGNARSGLFSAAEETTTTESHHSYYGVNAFLGKAILGLVQAFVFNWIYFDIDSADIHVHAIRRRPESAYVWQYAHLVFTVAFILSSAALTHLVVATDCLNAPFVALTETYQARSAATVSLGLRLYYSTGLGVALAALTAIAACHKHKIAPTAHRLSKRVRLANRLAVAAVFCALPAAQGLTSLQLVSIATGLIVYVLVVDLVGMSCRGDDLLWWRRGAADKKKEKKDDSPQYTAECSKKRLRQLLKREAAATGGGGGGGGDDGGESGRSSKAPVVDVNVLTQAEKHGAIYME